MTCMVIGEQTAQKMRCFLTHHFLSALHECRKYRLVAYHQLFHSVLGFLLMVGCLLLKILRLEQH